MASSSICARCFFEVALVRIRTRGFEVAAATFCTAGDSGAAATLAGASGFSGTSWELTVLPVVGGPLGC